MKCFYFDTGSSRLGPLDVSAEDSPWRPVLKTCTPADFCVGRNVEEETRPSAVDMFTTALYRTSFSSLFSPQTAFGASSTLCWTRTSITDSVLDPWISRSSLGVDKVLFGGLRMMVLLHQTMTFNSHWTVGGCMGSDLTVQAGTRT